MAKTQQTVEQVLHQTSAAFVTDMLAIYFTLQVAIVLLVLCGAVWMCLRNSFFSHGPLTKQYEHYH